jgi:hypothetical protein
VDVPSKGDPRKLDLPVVAVPAAREMKRSQAARLMAKDAQVGCCGEDGSTEMFYRRESSACVDAIHAVKPGETHRLRGTTGSNPGILRDPQIRKTSAESTFSYQTLLVTGFIPPASTKSH